MIHRAVLGTFERFLGVAIEHFAARFPFWLSPHQVVLIPQNDAKPAHLEHCEGLMQVLYDEGFSASVDDGGGSMLKKIARARDKLLAHVILVVGDREIADNTVCVRWWNSPRKSSENKDALPVPWETFLAGIRLKVANYQ